MSRHRRQQRKRARRARLNAWLDAELAKDFEAAMRGIEEAMAELRELSIRHAVSALEARLRREAREEEEQRRAG